MNADGQMFKSTDEQNEVAESEPEPEPEPKPKPERGRELEAAVASRATVQKQARRRPTRRKFVADSDGPTDTTARTTTTAAAAAAATTMAPPRAGTATTEPRPPPPHVPTPEHQPGAAAAEEEEEDGPEAEAQTEADVVVGGEVVVEEANKAPSTDSVVADSMVMAHAFEGGHALRQLTVAAGEAVELLNTHTADGWSWVRSSSGAEGYVPEGYLKSA